MRAVPLLALLALAAAAPAYAATDALEPAPVPSIAPRSAQDGASATVPEQMAPAGVGNNIAGPANATPFSSTPSANMPPDAAMPSRRDGTQGGAGGIVPNTSK